MISLIHPNGMHSSRVISLTHIILSLSTKSKACRSSPMTAGIPPPPSPMPSSSTSTIPSSCCCITRKDC
ncbi:unnamed protein product [Musa hybrid cultivar]